MKGNFISKILFKISPKLYTSVQKIILKTNKVLQYLRFNSQICVFCISI